MEYSDYDYVLYEAARHVQVSEHISFIYDFKEEYSTDNEVKSEIDVVTELFKDRDYSTLKSVYNDHELTEKELAGMRSLHLFYGTTKDVVLVYVKHRNGDHIVFDRIGAHEKVYDPDYEKKDKTRQIKKRWKTKR